MLQPMNGVGTAMEREANASSGSPDTKFSAAAAGIVPSQNARIQVIGVGGGGSNAINRMIASELHGVGFWVLNTDAQALLNSAANQRVQLEPGDVLAAGVYTMQAQLGSQQLQQRFLVK